MDRIEARAKEHIESRYVTERTTKSLSKRASQNCMLILRGHLVPGAPASSSARFFHRADEGVGAPGYRLSARPLSGFRESDNLLGMIARTRPQLGFIAALLLATVVAGCAKSGKSPAQVLSKPPKIETVPAKSAPFIAGKSAKIYHRRGCPYAANLSSTKGYSHADDAEHAGHIPCEFCRPRDPNAPLPGAASDRVAP